MDCENNRNEYLIYALESIIEIGNQKVSDLSKLVVYKYLYLAYINLKSIGINIELPYSWYCHGTMIESKGFSYHTGGLILSNYFFEEYFAINYYALSPTLSITDGDKKIISSTIERIINTYSESRQTKIKQLLKDVYTYAPHDFQREFKEKMVWCNPSEFRLNLQNTLDTLKHTFPREKYADIYPQYLRWDDTMHIALKLDVSNRELFELRNEFWNFFASYLRSRENENLTEYEQEQLNTFANERKDKFNAILFEIRENYLLSQSTVHNNDENKTSSLLKDITKVAYSAFILER